MKSPEMEMRPPISEHPTAEPKSKTPSIKEVKGLQTRKYIALPDGQIITFRGEKRIRTLRLLVTSFNQGQPYVPNEEFIGFDNTKGIPPSLMQRRRVYKAIYGLKHKTLAGTGWKIQSITVNGKGVEKRPKGYVLKKDKDAPTSLLRSIFDNETVLSDLVTDRPAKASILEKAKQQINAFDPQEKVLFLEKIFAILSDPNPDSQNQREAALELLNVVDLKSINPKDLSKSYTKAVYDLWEDLNQDSDPYGEIHALLEAGKIIAPFIENGKAISRAWNPVAEAFVGDVRQKILDDIEKIRQLIPTTISEFDIKVRMYIIKERLRNLEIAVKLGVTELEVRLAAGRLRRKGLLKSFPRPRGRMQTEQQKQLVEEVRDYRNKGTNNLAIAEALGITQEKVGGIAHILIGRGEIPRIKNSGPKKKV